LVRLDRASLARGGRTILRDVDLHVMPGERLLVTGPNGAGKSTLLRAIAGLDAIVPGGGARRYAIGGVVTASPLAVRRAVAMLGPEHQERFTRLRSTLAVREVAASGLDGTDYPHRVLDAAERRRVDAALAACGLAELADRPVEELSHGALRRTLLARALVGEPRLLVLDEALEGLDAASHATVLDLLRARERSCALVLSSHRPQALASLVDRAVRVEGGAVRPVDLAGGGARRSPVIVSPPRSALCAGGEPLVAFAGVDLAIEGRPILREVTWTIRAGDHRRIVGPNGSGKSTLARAVAGELAPAYGGSAAWFGAAMRPSVAVLRARIALVSDAGQTRYDRDETAREVVGSGCFGSIGLYETLSAAQERAVVEALARCASLDCADAPFASLSFGRRRRVLLARALVRRPDLLILDETFAGLDGAARARLFATLGELAAAGTTIVVVAHHDDDVPDWIAGSVRLADGRVRVD